LVQFAQQGGGDGKGTKTDLDKGTGVKGRYAGKKKTCNPDVKSGGGGRGSVTKREDGCFLQRT